MMNDEIDEVRLNALKALEFITGRFSCVLFMEHLKVVASVLDDANAQLRDGVRRILCASRLIDRGSIRLVYESLRNCIQRYPGDLAKIFECLGAVAFAHGRICEHVFEEYFDSCRTALAPEPNVSDASYMMALILVANASFSNPKMVSLLPEFTWAHVDYVSLRYPKAFHSRNVCLLHAIFYYLSCSLLA